jgi:hypothetical protein
MKRQGRKNQETRQLQGSEKKTRNKAAREEKTRQWQGKKPDKSTQGETKPSSL